MGHKFGWNSGIKTEISWLLLLKYSNQKWANLYDHGQLPPN